MEKKTNAVEVFHQFAEDELKNHFAELNTRYENEPLGSEELKRQAYEALQKICSQELEEKCDRFYQQKIMATSKLNWKI